MKHTSIRQELKVGQGPNLKSTPSFMDSVSLVNRGSQKLIRRATESTKVH
jgi:hypothetical protein